MASNIWHAGLICVSPASWPDCGKVRSSWMRSGGGIGSSVKHCDITCMAGSSNHPFDSTPPETQSPVVPSRVTQRTAQPTAGFRFIVVEAEQERPDEVRVRRVAEPPAHAARRPPFLNLEHGSLAGQIAVLEPLGDDTVQWAATLLEPALRFHDIARKGRKPYGVLATNRLKKAVESSPALYQWCLQKAFTVWRREQVEQDQDSRRFGGELLDAAFRRVQTHLQRLERECLADRDGELTVEDESAYLN